MSDFKAVSSGLVQPLQATVYPNRNLLKKPEKTPVSDKGL